MREATKAHRSTGSTGTLAAIVLLSAYCAPLMAAPSIPCKEASAARHDPIDLTRPDLSVAVAEHVADHKGTAPMTEPDEEDRLRRPSASTLSIAPRAETILRRIFDESYSSSELEALKPASSTDAKSIAELTAPAEPAKSSSETEESELPSLDADLPGMSEDETLRYRRQMFRTDI